VNGCTGDVVGGDVEVTVLLAEADWDLFPLCSEVGGAS